MPNRLNIAAPQKDQQCDIEEWLQAMECTKLTDLMNNINKISSGSSLGTVSSQTNAIPENIKSPNLLALRTVNKFRECGKVK